jgi:hypothetical protein
MDMYGQLCVCEGRPTVEWQSLEPPNFVSTIIRVSYISLRYLQLVSAAATGGVYRPHIGLLRVRCKRKIDKVVLVVSYN